MNETVLVLDNIRSVHNVGSIFRTADAAGVSKIYLVGVTPAPVDRFGRKRRDLAKVALGAEESVSWEQAPDAAGLLGRMRNEGYQIVAVEQSERSVDYKGLRLSFPCALVYGSETEGLAASTLALCDVVAEIPMRGTKESLNVAVSVGITLSRFLDL